MFKESAGSGRLPLFTGKMFHQFEETEQHSGYWIEEDKARDRLTKRGMDDIGQTYDYEGYRWVHRRISRSTDTRTLITTIAPPGVITEVNSTTLKVHDEEGTRLISNAAQLYLTAVSNSFTLDWLLRKQVTTTLNMFFLYQLPVPRLSEGHPTFDRLAELAARLVCTTPAFDALAAEYGVGRPHRRGNRGRRARSHPGRDRRPGGVDLWAHRGGVRARLVRREHHRLPPCRGRRSGGRPPSVPVSRPSPDDVLVANLIAGGEGTLVEFKETFAVNNETGDKHKGVLHSALKTISGFLNTTGGSLLAGRHGCQRAGGTGQGLRAVPGEQPERRRPGEQDPDDAGGSPHLPPSFGHVDVTFHQIDGQEVCRVLVQPSDQPTRLDGDFYVRDGNRTPKLTDDQAERSAGQPPAARGLIRPSQPPHPPRRKQSMKAGRIDLYQLFDTNVTYVAPLFQRPYVWTGTANLEPLWLAAHGVAEQRLNGKDPVRPHFMGAVVLNEQRAATGTVPARELIDGQQRLTTLQVLLATLRDTPRPEGSTTSGAFSDLVTNKARFAKESRDKYKVWPTNADRDAFVVAMSPGGRRRWIQDREGQALLQRGY